MTQRPDCYTCRFRVPAADHSECRHLGASITRGMAFMAAAHAAPEDAKEVGIETGDTPGGAAIKISFEAEAAMDGRATWPFNFDPTWLRACSGWEAIPVPAAPAEVADAS